MKFLLAGLGNIGQEYDATRHNIGFDMADTFVIKNGGTFNDGKFADVAEIKWKGKIFIVIKPTTYMNLSGKAVKYWLDKEKIQPDNMLVLVDDLALPIGTLRIRAAGSAGGQNGLKNIQELLQTDKYPRLRFGIGNDYPKGRQVDYVLGKWKAQELPAVKDAVMRSIDLIECWAQQGIGAAMTAFNK